MISQLAILLGLIKLKSIIRRVKKGIANDMLTRHRLINMSGVGVKSVYFVI